MGLAGTGGIAILLVEDNALDVELCLRDLHRSRLANQIDVAHDGEEALDFLFSRGAYSDHALSGPLLVLLDLKLPKIDGLMVLRAMKSDPRTRAIPVVVLTSTSNERELIGVYELGADACMQKPVVFDSLCGTIKKLALSLLLVSERAAS